MVEDTTEQQLANLATSGAIDICIPSDITRECKCQNRSTESLQWPYIAALEMR